jgi:cytochrome c biogenesis protein
VVAAQIWPQASAGLIAAPLAVLALNLACALWVFPRLRRGGLGLFHFSLLACLLLVAGGRLTHFDGHVYIADGQEFDPAAVEIDSRGPWHGDGIRRLAFLQGSFTVTYAPGVKRKHTNSQVALPGEPQWRAVNDDTPLVLGGYRFYVTPNKGFAPLLTWSAAGAAPVTGAVMLPSYPVNDWQQVHHWTAPGGAVWNLALRTRPLDEVNAWTLAPATTASVLVAESAGQRHELRPGEEVRTATGVLRYESLAGWMGYRIFYDPTLFPLLGISLLGVAGLAWHLWLRMGRPAPVPQGAAA